jgi:hypothetical protein
MAEARVEIRAGALLSSAELARHADADPAGPEARDLIEALAAAGAWKEALERARAAARACGDAVDGVLALARGALVDGRLDRAEKTLEQLGRGLEAAPQRRGEVATVWFALLRRREGPVEAVAWLRAQAAAHPDDAGLAAVALRLAPAEPDVRGKLPLESLARAQRMLAAGQPGRALRLLRRLALAHPGDADVQAARVHAAGAVLDAGDGLADVIVGMPIDEASDLYVDLEPLDLA